MKNKVKIAAISLVVAFQFAVLVLIIVNSYFTVKNAPEYLIEVEGYDPYQPMLGRYLELRISGRDVVSEINEKSKTTYLVFTEDEGRLTLTTIQSEKPDSGIYIATKNIKSPRLVRYYIQENLAERIDKILRDTTEDIYIKVKIRRGKYVIEDLLVGDISINDSLGLLFFEVLKD
ncbi:MAG: GDYXXLXY domain-containing protein [Spirochaetales bacterium]|nr:GDYXXLXY domain-containing protein [Spirochaetales bacterium]